MISTFDGLVPRHFVWRQKVKNSKGKPVHGYIVLDKPKGLTSNAALQNVKRRLEALKAGHTGALDPMATGVLPLCFGEGTKFSQVLLEADKAYITKLRLGIQTTTGDVEGDVIAERAIPSSLDIFKFDKILINFRGKLKQVPSMFSALKHKGVPLYKLARQGIVVERKARVISVYELKIVSWDLPFVDLRVKCSKGTYIRNLVEDIGNKVGCGAHVVELRRISSGPYSIDQAVSMDYFDQPLDNRRLAEILMPVDSALFQFKELLLNDSQSSSIMQGQTVTLPAPERKPMFEVPLRLYNRDREEQFLGLGILNAASELKAMRLLNPEGLV